MRDVGIVLVMPAHKRDSDASPATLLVDPCLTKPLGSSNRYEVVSPAFCIRSNRATLQTNTVVHIQHYVSLKSEDDCKDMIFLYAYPKAEHGKNQIVYAFKELSWVTGKFEVGSQIGEISLNQFGFLLVVAKRVSGKGSKNLVHNYVCIYIILLRIRELYM